MDIPELQLWLKSHAISEEIATEFEIGWNGNQIVIPVFDENGKTIFNKYRRNPTKEGGAKYFYDAGSKTALYGIQKLKDLKTVVIVEGEADCLSLWSHNIPSVTSTGGTLSFQKEWAPLFANKDVYICYDNDIPGVRGAIKTLSLLPLAKIVFVPNLFSIKDVGDYYAHGMDFKLLMDGAKQFVDYEEVLKERGIARGKGEPIEFHNLWIENWESKQWDNEKNAVRVGAEIGNDLERAKSVPIETFVRMNRERKVICLFHKEKNPSMHIFPNNTAYCFSCGTRADVIDIVMKLKDISFKEAIKFLIK